MNGGHGCEVWELADGTWKDACITSWLARPPGSVHEIARYVDTIEPLLRRGATLELDVQRPASELADVIEDRNRSRLPISGSLSDEAIKD